MLRIDGGTKSGSGTILRTTVVLAALLGKEVEVFNIRARRPRPGIRPQHLAVLHAVRDITDGTLRNAEVNSSRIVFTPRRKPKPGNYEWEIPSAGSAVLLAESLLPLAIFSGGQTRFTVVGGLFQDFAPSGFHAQHALLPTLAQMGAQTKIEILRPGYYPKGGGLLRIDTNPVAKNLTNLTVTHREGTDHVRGIALSSHLERQEVSRRMADSCRDCLEGHGLTVAFQLIEDHTAPQPGAALAVFSRDPSGSVLAADLSGAQRRRSEDIGRQVAQAFWTDLRSGATVDRFLADQLIVPAALAEGVSEYIVPGSTDHIESNLWLIEELLGAQGRLDGNKLSIQGIGFRAPET